MADPHPLPSSAPEALQTIQTAAALAKVMNVHLIVSRGEDENPESYYRLDIPDDLHIHDIPNFKKEHGLVRPSWNLPFFIITLFNAATLRKKERINALLIRNLKLAAFLLRCRRMVKLPPVIFEIHEIFSFSFGDELRIKDKKPGSKALRLAEKEKYVYENADGIICTTNHVADEIRKRFSISCPILVAPNGVDSSVLDQCMDKEPEAENNTEGGRLILYLGSLHHWKGIDVLIEALQYIPCASLEIVGGDSERINVYREYAAKLGLENRIHFEGYVKPARRFSFMARADICVLPLKPLSVALFASPIKLFEYMASGTPVVASDLPSTREIIKDGISGILVPPDDPKALAEAINRLINDKELGRRLAARAKSDVREFTWENRGEKIAGFLRSNWS